MELNDILTILLSFIAVCIALVTFFSQREFNRHSLRAVCKFDVYSLNGSIRIIFRNVGSGVMRIKCISYCCTEDSITISTLSSWLQDIPCEANSEYNLNETWMGASMSYNLLSRTVGSQEDLDRTWDKLKDLHIKVEYEDTFGEIYEDNYELMIDYEIYSAAKGARNLI